MRITYVVTTIVVALANGYAAALNFAGAESVKVVADRAHVSTRWMIPFGVVLAAGALGLLIGLAVPGLRTAAAIGLVSYFICAVAAHARAGDQRVGGAGSGGGRADDRPGSPTPLVIAKMDEREWLSQRFHQHRSHPRAGRRSRKFTCPTLW
jgi:hypothetical protein